MKSSTTADALRLFRISIGVSQSGLARISGVQRWKINAFELGDIKLSDDELRKLRAAFQTQLDRLHNLPANMDLAGFSDRAGQTNCDGGLRRSAGGLTP
jgi:plasmid maintenance system antidote protein VapI